MKSLTPLIALIVLLPQTLATAECDKPNIRDKPNIIVFYTDDHGHADLSCQGVLKDIKTPNVDALARRGVLARHGYSTAPQCVPSRAGLLVGKFQSRFGVEANGYPLDGFDREQTIAERLQQAGYVTAQFGKWHLGPGPAITQHGFKHVFNQNAQRPFSANITLGAEDREMSNLKPERYHVDGCSEAAASIIERYKDAPFFLYVAYRAPHVPLDAPRKYLDRFPGKMPERRRQALAMLSAVDDGVGLITKTLAEHALTEQTLIFFIGDNGAPLKIHKADAPGGGPGWDGSLNDPLNGEKGMLAEGGMHVPFVVCWPGTIPAGQIYDHPISALDVAATAIAIANHDTPANELDGVNLIPYLTGQNDAAPHDTLMWRWTAQSAIREGKWKLLLAGDREYLYDLDADLEEKHNVAFEYPELVTRLRERLTSWAATLEPFALSNTPNAYNAFYDFYMDGKPVEPRAGSPRRSPARPELQGWISRNSELTVEDGSLCMSSKSSATAPFFVYNGLQLPGPVTATIQLTSSNRGEAAISWRTSTQKDFLPECKAVSEITTADQWATHTIELPVQGKLIHLRFIVPSGTTTIREFKLESPSGKAVVLWK
ncbi:Arylsulfatase precursor [Planctomycetes bacterium CA13]|uniref:Arylsulfatase n=1 Tax=Novipirellula herctigrandis TaxID=2527986 RepID=A0A5C5ZDH1_9BACT|nr:Arylsulfatase precursor [Planctomycetes bacterium CA13]